MLKTNLFYDQIRVDIVPRNKDLHGSDKKTLHVRATQTLSNFLFVQEHFNKNAPHARFLYANREQTCLYYPHFAYKINPSLRLGTIRNFDPIKKLCCIPASRKSVPPVFHTYRSSPSARSGNSTRIRRYAILARFEIHN